MKSGRHPGELKDAICAPGGTTIVGISALEESGHCNAGSIASFVAAIHAKNEE